MVVQQLDSTDQGLEFFSLSLFPVFRLSGLQIRKFPTCNTYMDDPFHLSLTSREQPIYSNTSVLEHKVS